MCVASGVSRRNTRPGATMWIGGCSSSIVRIWTGDVCVRSTVVPGSSARRDVVDEQRVEFTTRRVSLSHVERLEVVPVGLDLGALRDSEAEADEHVLETFPRLGHQVGMAAASACRRTR